MTILFTRLSKKELLNYRQLRRANKFNVRIEKFVKINGSIKSKSFVVGKINNEHDCN